MKNIFLLLFAILLTGGVSATDKSRSLTPESKNSIVSAASSAAYYSDYLNHQSLSLFDQYRLETKIGAGGFSFHEERKPKIDLFNLLMTGLAVGGAVIMASGGGGGGSSSSAAPSAPPGTPVTPNNPTSGVSVAITPTINCAIETSNPACTKPCRHR